MAGLGGRPPAAATHKDIGLAGRDPGPGAGGDLLTAEQLYEVTKKAMDTGIIGVSFGRNVFMSDNPEETIRRLSQIICD